MAESNNDASEFRNRTYNTGKEDYDRLLAVFHTGTNVKRCLLTQFLRENRLILLQWLTDLDQTFLRFDDVKRAIKRSSIIQLKDLEPSTIDILLKFHCFNMFWDKCLFNTRLEEVLNIHKDELLTIYQNSMTQDSIASMSTEQYAPSLSRNQWELLFKSVECCGIKGKGIYHEFFATKNISLSSLDETLNVLLLYTVCPLYKSMITVCECQIQITKLAVLNSECEKTTFEHLWNKIESHIIIISDHCMIFDDFKRECETIKHTFFNRTLSQEKRKPILEDAFNNPDFIRVSLSLKKNPI